MKGFLYPAEVFPEDILLFLSGICDIVERASRNRRYKRMANSSSRIRISFNSPVILGFTLLSFAALLLDKATGGMTNNLLFSVYHSSLLSPLTYVRFFGHVLGHAGWEHFIGNIMLLLVTGPLLEENTVR